MTLQPGPLSPGMVSLLTAGRSVLRDRVWGLVVFDRFDDSERRAFLTGLLDGQARLLVPAHMEYIGELADPAEPKGWITAPPGGWKENPVPGRRVDVRYSWKSCPMLSGEPAEVVVWPRVEALRPVDEATGESGCGHTEVGLSCRDGRATGTCFKCKVTLSADELAAMSAEPVADRWADLERLAKAATPGPWDHMAGRDLVRALRGDLAIPLCEVLEPHGDPLLAAPTCRVGKEVVFRANTHGARDSAAIKQANRNAHYFAALSPSTVLELIAAARAKEAGE